MAQFTSSSQKLISIARIAVQYTGSRNTEDLTNTEALNRKKSTICKTAECETQIFLFLHRARNVDSLENGEITLQVNSATDIDSHISKNDISHPQVTVVKGKTDRLHTRD